MRICLTHKPPHTPHIPPHTHPSQSPYNPHTPHTPLQTHPHTPHLYTTLHTYRCTTRSQPCLSNPCLYQGTCEEAPLADSYRCHCLPGTSGQYFTVYISITIVYTIVTDMYHISVRVDLY